MSDLKNNKDLITKDEIADSVVKYYITNKSIIDRMTGLTQEILLTHLKEAINYQKGYYKNGNGVYLYIKGIEVTNDLSNLSRMGYNGEDRGVWVHYCLVDDKSVTYLDTPITTFNANWFNKKFCKKKELMHPITKDEFEDKVKTTVETLCADYDGAIDPEKYHEVAKTWIALMNKFLNFETEKEETL